MEATILILAFLAGVSNAFMDRTKHLSSWIGSTWYNLESGWWYDYAHPQVSWKRKYKNGRKQDGPRFFLSTTFFVFLTDAWHFSQAMWRRFFIGVVLVYGVTLALKYWEGGEIGPVLGMFQIRWIDAPFWNNTINLTIDAVTISVSYLIAFNLF